MVSAISRTHDGVMSDTTTPPPPPPTSGSAGGDGPQGPDHDGPRVGRNDLKDLSRMRRAVGPDRKIAGVAGGIARYLDIDPIIVRVLLVVLTCFGGSGLIVYLAGWVLLPDEGSEARPLGLDDRSRGVALMVAGALAAIAALADGIGGDFGFPFPAVVIGLGILLVVVVLQQQRSGRPGGYRPAAPYSAPPPYGERPAAYGEPAGPFPAVAYAPPSLPTDPTTGQANAPLWTPPTTSGPAWIPPPPPMRRSDERKRGPILFLATLALIAVALGSLGVVDLAGTSVAAAAYPVTALAVVGAMLVVGAFWGRAGGLIATGLLILPVLVGTAVVDRWDGAHEVTLRPTSAGEVLTNYEIQDGRLVVDLTDVDDVDDLDGLRIDLDARAGEIRVLVPHGVQVDVTAAVTGVGDIDLFDTNVNGFDISDSRQSPGGRFGDPELDIDARLSVGQITVQQGESR